jgi:hypothetical protein
MSMPFVPDLLKYLGGVFVETGTYKGDTIDILLQLDEFKESQIYSLELSDVFYERCKAKYANRDNVTIVHANSKYELFSVIENINTPITFWLDSHWSGIPDVGFDADTICPILYELKQIKQHHINTHTIIVDDIRLMNGEHFPVTLDEIAVHIMDINPNYKLILYDDEFAEHDVLVASLE